jgi:hypothetical protein
MAGSRSVTPVASSSRRAAVVVPSARVTSNPLWVAVAACTVRLRAWMLG